jgi:hypothetical protein
MGFRQGASGGTTSTGGAFRRAALKLSGTFLGLADGVAAIIAATATGTAAIIAVR